MNVDVVRKENSISKGEGWKHPVLTIVKSTLGDKKMFQFVVA